MAVHPAIKDGGSGTNAVTVRNHLVKSLGMKSKYSGPSNKYSDVQSLHGQLHPDKAKKLQDHLRENGWKEEETRRYNEGPAGVGVPRGKQYTNKDGLRVSVDNDGSVGIHGKKRAKKSSLPQYD